MRGGGGFKMSRPSANIQNRGYETSRAQDGSGGYMNGKEQVGQTDCIILLYNLVILQSIVQV